MTGWTRSKSRWAAVAASATLLALVGASAHPPPGQAIPPSPTFAGGEGVEEAGPRLGRVDPRFSSPEAARRTLHSEHEHHHQGHRPSSGATALSAESGVAAVLDPKVFGSWKRTAYNLPMRAIHATLLRNGKVLLIAGSGNEQAVFQAGSFQAGLLSPATGAYQPINPPYDMFCAGHAQLPNGNILIVGGTAQYPSATTDWKGSKRVHEFDVARERWVSRASLAHGRWYPSSVQAPSGHVWNFAGEDENGNQNKTVERYTTSTGAISAKPGWSLPKYPGLLWTAKDRVFYAGTRSGGGAGQPGLYHPSTGAVQPVKGITMLDRRRAAATVFAGDATGQRVLVVGGGFPATNTTSYIDLRPATPVGVAGPNLSTAKAFVGAVNLPTDGSVFQTGGGTGRDTPVFESSIIRGNAVVPLAPNTVARTYHSSTLLLPDGRIMTMGGDDVGPGFEMQVEVFTPPYLYQGTRPVITAAPSSVGYSTSHTVSATATGATLASAWLVRPSSTTHSVDPNQRAVRLTAARVSGGLRITTPTKYVAAPGYYMLFVNDSSGRPSVARWVKVG
jgi:hypothetical protein